MIVRSDSVFVRLHTGKLRQVVTIYTKEGLGQRHTQNLRTSMVVELQASCRLQTLAREHPSRPPA